VSVFPDCVLLRKPAYAGQWRRSSASKFEKSTSVRASKNVEVYADFATKVNVAKVIDKKVK